MSYGARTAQKSGLQTHELSSFALFSCVQMNTGDVYLMSAHISPDPGIRTLTQTMVAVRWLEDVTSIGQKSKSIGSRRGHNSAEEQKS
jgi:hypothetical protein